MYNAGKEIADLSELVETGVDFLGLVVTREEVINKDYSRVMPMLRGLTNTVSIASHFRERVDVSFHGYEHTRQELWEDPDVRDFVHQMDEEFPYWLYFLSKLTSGLACVTNCFLLPFLTEEGKEVHHPKQLEDLLEKRWWPAMNHLCNYTGIDVAENKEMTNRYYDYIVNGPNLTIL